MENEACERVYAEVSLDAVRSNAERMKENLPAGTKMIAVVKADGYGHGAVPVAKELEGAGCADGFAVATAREAFSLKEAGITGPILILGYCFPCDYERAVEEEIRITVFRRDTLRELSEIYEQNLKKGLCRKARVHIKVDTGMSRIGVWPDESGISFVEEAFGQENEMLILLTELTGNSASARFIAGFGSPDYARFSEDMMLARRRDDLQERIAALEL